MKIIFNIFIVISFLTLRSMASSRSDVLILESTEKIRYLGQKISKEYLYLYYNPKKIEFKKKLFSDIVLLEGAINDISMSTINVDSKNILDFLTYNKDEIKELLDKKVNKERSILMLDYSESFLESANSIASVHKYEFNDEEKMLMLMKKLDYLLERTSKYYIASNLNLDKINNFKHMKNAILEIDNILKEIELYKYPDSIKEQREKMVKLWQIEKELFYKSEKVFIPNLLQSSLKNLQDSIEKIMLYHKKNQ